ncbi:conserved hypothetical protein; putative membrane protein (plasmid) [Trichlorobacter lovleyi SZ]|uniref:DoxX family protein n=2 Tax=Trichlorobacter lovleyi TaxID=313985 RepID=B3EBW9_TRIL1|nr:conserved hypothetical protein; putative membrane protein [Trichlorobacter lovleyi SZ]
MLVPGTVKFFEPFKTFFTTQIDRSGLPFSTLTFWSGQLGEITVGLTLLAFLFLWEKITPSWAKKIFYGGNLAVTVIMLVALYVHLHPAVPAEVLPFEKKAPLLTVFTLLMVFLNVYLYRNAGRTILRGKEVLGKI